MAASPLDTPVAALQTSTELVSIADTTSASPIPVVSLEVAQRLNLNKAAMLSTVLETQRRARLGLTGGGGGIIWEVGNEVDFEHGHTPESYTADFDAIVMGVREALGIGSSVPNSRSLDGTRNGSSPAMCRGVDTPSESAEGAAPTMRGAVSRLEGELTADGSDAAAAVDVEPALSSLATHSQALLPLDALLFNGMNLPNIDNTSVVVEWARYFLNASNHHPAVRDAAALAFFGYHAYPTQGGFTPDPDTFSGMFSYVDDLFLPKVRAWRSRMRGAWCAYEQRVLRLARGA